MSLNEWYEKAMSAEAYIQSMEKNKDNLQLIYDQFEIPAGNDQFLSKLKDKQLRVIALTEDWCGDAMINIPILLKMAEKANIDVRMLLRDQNLELMDQYLTNGTSRAIPIFIFIDEAGKEVAVWGPRAESIQKIVDEQRAKLPDQDDESFPAKQKEMIKYMGNLYVTDRSLWEEVFSSLKERLETVL